MTVPARPRVLLLSAYDAGSHRRWRQQLVASQPGFDWHCLSLPPRHFRWRIRGNALSWLNEPLLHAPWDLLVVTSMVDLATLRGVCPALAGTPALLYMHENQFAYPVSESQHASLDPQMVNLYAALSAEAVVFNSEWNRVSFLQGVQALLETLPDQVPAGVVAQLAGKSSVLPVPIADHHFRPRTAPVNVRHPHLVWNHRWEYDKAPERLLALLDRLVERGQSFRLSVVGEQFRRQPEALTLLSSRFADRIEHWGYLARDVYEALIGSADVVISTALHDFQGLAMLEAMAGGCLALAPDRLAYPEYVPANQCYPSWPENARAEADAAADVLMSLLSDPPTAVRPDDWRLSVLQPRYRQHLQALLD